MIKNTLKLKNRLQVKISLILTLTLIFLTGCSSGTGLDNLFADIIRLEEFTGEVFIETDDGVFLNPNEEMKLQSGYQIHTKEDSSAFFSLDDTKSIKLDSLSSVEIQDDGKNLLLTLNEGELFFNVTEPLKDDETMNIQTSNMITGIRGTSGYVSAHEENGTLNSTTTLLTGKVSIHAIDEDGSLLNENILLPGQTAFYDTDDLEDKVTISNTSKGSIPDFVKSAIDDDDDLKDEIGDFDDFDDDDDNDNNDDNDDDDDDNNDDNDNDNDDDNDNDNDDDDNDDNSYDANNSDDINDSDNDDDASDVDYDDPDDDNDAYFSSPAPTAAPDDDDDDASDVDYDDPDDDGDSEDDD